MLNILILVSRQGMLEEALAIARYLYKTSNSRATLLMSGELAFRTKNATPFKNDVACKFVSDRPPITGSFLYRIFGIGPIAILRTLFKIHWRRRWVDGQLEAIRPELLIVFDDRIVDPEMIWLDRAARLSIPSLLVRYAASSIESDAWGRRNRVTHSLERGPLVWVRRMFAHFYPNHVLTINMRKQLFFSTWDSLALALCGMAQTSPWVAGGGNISVAALQGRVDLEEALSNYREPKRFEITGQATWDGMAKLVKLNHNWRNDEHISEKLVIICAVPQWGEHLQLSWIDHIKKIEHLSALLDISKCKVVLSLHPKARREIYQPIADRYNLQISDQPLTLILPGANLFLASWSSTLRWAAMLGIPSVNLDWVQQRYTLFSRLQSLPTSESPEDLGPLLSRLVDNPSIRQSLAEALKEESSVYGIIDGQSGQRILSLIENIVARGNHE